ncbi:MAG: hypothetical protein COB09_08285 [Thalassobium sp.]|nr:MAG: hypothetical protein COB09_08285 [Thalassobium sp.]
MVESIIRTKRKELQLTQGELGKLCGVSKTTVVNWEQGINKPKGEHLIALGRALKVGAEAILTGGVTACGDISGSDSDGLSNRQISIHSDRAVLLRVAAEALGASAVISVMNARESGYTPSEIVLLESLLVRLLKESAGA